MITWSSHPLVNARISMFIMATSQTFPFDGLAFDTMMTLNGWNDELGAL